MVKDLVLDRCGLGLIINDVDVVKMSVFGIKMATTKNNKNIIVVAFDETRL